MTSTTNVRWCESAVDLSLSTASTTVFSAVSAPIAMSVPYWSLSIEPGRPTMRNGGGFSALSAGIAPAEASSNLARFDGVRYGFRDRSADSLIEMYNQTRSQGFGDEVKRRILIGTYALSSGYYDAFYKKASQVRTLIKEDFAWAFAACDLVVSPVTPTPAWRIGDKADDPLALYLSDILTLSANLAGIPGMSVPCGFSDEGLPIGMQLTGRMFDESTLLSAAHAYEQRAGWWQHEPTL